MVNLLTTPTCFSLNITWERGRNVSPRVRSLVLRGGRVPQISKKISSRALNTKGSHKNHTLFLELKKEQLISYPSSKTSYIQICHNPRKDASMFDH